MHDTPPPFTLATCRKAHRLASYQPRSRVYCGDAALRLTLAIEFDEF